MVNGRNSVFCHFLFDIYFRIQYILFVTTEMHMFNKIILFINDKLATAILYSIFENERLAHAQAVIALKLQTALRKLFNIEFDYENNEFYIEK